MDRMIDLLGMASAARDTLLDRSITVQKFISSKILGSAEQIDSRQCISWPRIRQHVANEMDLDRHQTGA
jgi:hypothetical protein